MTARSSTRRPAKPAPAVRCPLADNVAPLPREAGLVHEERRGTWSFSTLDSESAPGLLANLAARLGA